MGRLRREMRDVVLVEGDAPVASPGGPARPVGAADAGTPPAPGLSRAGLRRARLDLARRWWPVAAVLTLAVVITTAVSDGRERARQAVLAGAHGIIAPLDGPVSELWRTDVSLWPGLTLSGGRLVGVENRPEGGVDVVALDPRTGAALWRAASRPPGGRTAGTSCALPEAPRSSGATPPVPIVACIVADETMARLVVLEAATGAVLSDTSIEASTSVAAVGPDLVISYIDVDGRVRVRRTDARGTAQRWTYTVLDPPRGGSFGRRDAIIRVDDGLIVVGASDTSWVLSGDGRLLHTWTAGRLAVAGGRVDVLRAGRLLAEPAAIDVRVRGTRVLDLDTGGSFTVEGHPVGATPDDGSLADLILMRSSGSNDLTAYDLASGRPRWTGADASGGRMVILDGRIIQAGNESLKSIDGRTGETVWSTPVAHPAPLFTDGRLVLLTQPDPDLGAVLAAYGLDDGRRRWVADIADDLSLYAIDGRLYGASDQRLVTLGPDAA